MKKQIKIKHKSEELGSRVRYGEVEVGNLAFQNKIGISNGIHADEVLDSILHPSHSYFNPLIYDSEISVVDHGIKTLYKLESIGINESSDGTLDEIKIKEFNKTIIMFDYRYYVELSWQSELIKKVTSNYNIALATIQMSLKFLRQKDLYLTIPSEILYQLYHLKYSDGIVGKFNVDLLNYHNYIWVLHRPVIKMTKQVATKIRPVFNCSLRILIHSFRFTLWLREYFPGWS